MSEIPESVFQMSSDSGNSYSWFESNFHSVQTNLKCNRRRKFTLKKRTSHTSNVLMKHGYECRGWSYPLSTILLSDSLNIIARKWYLHVTCTVVCPLGQGFVCENSLLPKYWWTICFKSTTPYIESCRESSGVSDPPTRPNGRGFCQNNISDFEKSGFFEENFSKNPAWVGVGGRRGRKKSKCPLPKVVVDLIWRGSRKIALLALILAHDLDIFWLSSFSWPSWITDPSTKTYTRIKLTSTQVASRISPDLCTSCEDV